jgi:hypothetical protein
MLNKIYEIRHCPELVSPMARQISNQSITAQVTVCTPFFIPDFKVSYNNS